MDFHQKWKHFLFEAERDAKVLRNINIDFLKKEVEKEPAEEIRDYFVRLQQLERETPPVFPPELVNWVEGLDDRYFPRDGRKVFAKWLGNAVWHEEAEERSTPGPDFSELDIYNNDIRYIVDYLNGADNIPRETWSLSFRQMMEVATEWHEEFKGVESVGDYGTKEIIYNFKNGFTIVGVPPEDLDVEGNKMGHCVAGYCDYVESGSTAIYSLRNRKNEPHVTIEISLPRAGDPGFVDQIKGKGNDRPIEKYRPMIKQWLATTDYAYEESDDYFGILSSEEVIQMLEDGKLLNSRIQTIAKRSNNPQIIDFLISKIDSGLPGAPVSRHGHSAQNPLDNLVSNQHLSFEQAVEIFKKNLLHKRLGRQVEELFHRSYAELDDQKDYNADALAARCWPILKEKMIYWTPAGVDNAIAPMAFFEKAHLSEAEEVMYSMSAIVNYSSNEKLNRGVVDLLLDKRVINAFSSRGASSQLGGTYKIYTTIMQGYLNSTDHHDRGTLKKIHELTKTSAGEDLAPESNIQNYIARSQSIPKDLAVEIANNPAGHATTKNLLMNPNVDESLKYGIMKERIDTWRQPDGRSRGIMAMLGRTMWDEQKIFSEKFLLWSLDATVFDAVIERKATQKFVAKYDFPPVYDKPDKRFDDLFQKEKEKMREDIKRKKRFQSADEDPDRELPPWMENQLNEEVKNYFCEIAPVNSFYKKVENNILQEEKGRSRQRGIYKFYCMLSYSLTLEENKSRGLDDILADLRALPNVTIVTVVIRNQKIAEHRYVAGLSVKFIPSIPGQFNSPEQVKFRILQDVKRLSNVHTLFKVSSSFERLE